MSTTNADRQRRYRTRRAAREPIRQFVTVPVTGRRRTRPRRWADAIKELRALQDDYQAWRDRLPENLASSRTAGLLDEVCAVDLDSLDVNLPRGFGRD